jgi:RNA polymerase sigma-70 factor (ECF subfamily)
MPAPGKPLVGFAGVSRVATDLESSMTVEHSYERFYARELQPMVALAAAVTGSWLAAEDIAQEALVRAYRRWDRIAGYDKPGAWLRRVTINLALSSRRRLATELRSRFGTGPEPPVAAAALDRDDEVWAAVRELPGKQRAAIALHYLEDRPVVEIAEIHDCAESTAKVHLHRGRNALATMLEGTHR